MSKVDAEIYFIQYVFCCMNRLLLGKEFRPLYDKLFCIWLDVWQGLEGYAGENKIKLCGDMFKSQLTKGET